MQIGTCDFNIVKNCTSIQLIIADRSQASLSIIYYKNLIDILFLQLKFY